jgi:hypothetical protein
MKKILVAIIVGLSSMTSFSQKVKFDLNVAKKEIQLQINAFVDALSKSDSLALGNLYIKDAKILNHGSPSTIGRPAIIKDYGETVRSGDFGTLLTPTTFKLDVRAVIQTEDSATIYVTYTGFIYTDEETFKLMASGGAKLKVLSPDKYYFRINPIFETTSSKYDWLNHTVAIGVGTRTETGVSYKIYAIK